MPVVLTERQQTTVAAAMTILGAAVIVAAVLAMLWLLALFFRTFSGVFLPLAVAAVAAMVAKPYYDGIRRLLRLPPTLALALVLLSAIVPLVAFLWFSAPSWWDRPASWSRSSRNGGGVWSGWSRRTGLKW